jgi:hypothetical protein
MSSTNPSEKSEDTLIKMEENTLDSNEKNIAPVKDEPSDKKNTITLEDVGNDKRIHKNIEKYGNMTPKEELDYQRRKMYSGVQFTLVMCAWLLLVVIAFGYIYKRQSLLEFKRDIIESNSNAIPMQVNAIKNALDDLYYLSIAKPEYTNDSVRYDEKTNKPIQFGEEVKAHNGLVRKLRQYFRSRKDRIGYNVTTTQDTDPKAKYYVVSAIDNRQKVLDLKETVSEVIEAKKKSLYYSYISLIQSWEKANFFRPEDLSIPFPVVDVAIYGILFVVCVVVLYLVIDVYNPYRTAEQLRLMRDTCEGDNKDPAKCKELAVNSATKSEVDITFTKITMTIGVIMITVILASNIMTSSINYVDTLYANAQSGIT